MQIDHIPVRLRLHIVHPEDQAPSAQLINGLKDNLRLSIAPLAKQSKKLSPIDISKIITSTHAAQVPNVDNQALDSWFEDSIFSVALGSSRNGIYNLIIAVDPTAKEISAVIGAKRHAWIRIPKFDDSGALVPVMAAQLRHMLLYETNADNLRRHNYRFTFSLLNEDPFSTVINWNFSKLEHRTFRLSSFFGFSSLSNKHNKSLNSKHTIAPRTDLFGV